MALTQRSMFLYGLQVTENNRSIDFRSVLGETIRMASLRLGFYSLGSLGTEISRAMKAADPARDFSVSVNRNVAGGLENRVSITTSGDYLDLLGSSGPRAASSALSLIGFAASDYSGALTYSGNSSAGTRLSPRNVGYNYQGPNIKKEIFGNVNVSASGVKEAVVYSIQRFWQVEFEREIASSLNTDWNPFIDWIIQQRLVEFTPEITSPNTFYEGTLERTETNSKGLGHEMKEMLPNMPFLYRTGLLTFRVTN